MQGPIALDDLQHMAAEGILPAATQVCMEGTQTWQAITAVAVVPPDAAPVAPTEQADIATESESENGWFYAKGGKRIGPIGETEIRRLAFDGSLCRDSPVWRRGMSDWVPADQTNLRELFPVAAEPPPLTGESVDNSIVWTIAFVPLVASFVKGLLVVEYHSPQANFWWVALVLNIILCTVDLRKLHNAGYNTDGMLLGALFLIPLYLFQRARRLNQNNAYAFVWLITFFISLFL